MKEDVLKNHFMALLSEVNLWPITRWNSFPFEHSGAPTDKAHRSSQYKYLKSQVGKASGLYIYADDDLNVYYIGKGNPIYNRLVSHYRESFEHVSGGDEWNSWVKFFHQNHRKFTIYWAEIEEEADRKQVEKLLHWLLRSHFRNFFLYNSTRDWEQDYKARMQATKPRGADGNSG